MKEGATAGHEKWYREFIRTHEEITIENLQDKWNKEYLRRQEELQIKLEDLYDLKHLVIGIF